MTLAQKVDAAQQAVTDAYDATYKAWQAMRAATNQGGATEQFTNAARNYRIAQRKRDQIVNVLARLNDEKETRP